MIEANDLKVTIARVGSILSESGIKFHLTGVLASSYYGEPRFTQDIDIVIRVSLGTALDDLVLALSKCFVVDREVVQDAVRRGSIFQALDEETMIKVDFHVGEAIAGELERSRTVEIFSGTTVPLVSIEDAILSKLLWIRKGSHKGRQDVKMMLKQGDALDLQYLNSQARKLDLIDLFEELRAENAKP